MRPAARFARVRPPRTREDAVSVTTLVKSERQLQAQVEALLRLSGWRYYHTFDSRRSVAGFPDIVALKGRRVLVLELKSSKGTPTSDQMEWLVAWAASGAEVYVVRPKDLDELAIVAGSQGDSTTRPAVW